MGERAVVVCAPGHCVADDALSRWLSAAGYRVAVEDAATSIDPEVIVMSARFATNGAFDALEDLRRRHPVAPVLVLVERRNRKSAESMLAAGASFVMFWPVDPPALVLRVAQMIRCARDLREEIGRGDADGESGVRRSAGASRLAAAWRLSPRERQVLPLAVIGEAHKDISVRLDLSLRMVRWHADNIRRKSGCGTWAEIRGCWAREMGA